jgi:starch synthase
VVDAGPVALRQGTATGLVFDAATAAALEQALLRAVALYRQPEAWQRVTRHAMAADFSWQGAARAYLALYEEVLAQRGRPAAG